jgi:hypothetical protein
LLTCYGKQRTLEVVAVNGIKTDLWLTADKEVLPLTANNPELKSKTISKQGSNSAVLCRGWLPQQKNSPGRGVRTEDGGAG